MVLQNNSLIQIDISRTRKNDFRYAARRDGGGQVVRCIVHCLAAAVVQRRLLAVHCAVAAAFVARHFVGLLLVILLLLLLVERLRWYGAIQVINIDEMILKLELIWGQRACDMRDIQLRVEKALERT